MLGEKIPGSQNVFVSAGDCERNGHGVVVSGERGHGQINDGHN